MFGLFNFKKEAPVVNASKLSSNIDAIMSVFNIAVNNLTSVELDAQNKIQEHEVKIKELQEETDNLHRIINRASSLKHNLEGLLK